MRKEGHVIKQATAIISIAETFEEINGIGAV
jgi:hypothetical protein